DLFGRKIPSTGKIVQVRTIARRKIEIAERSPRITVSPEKQPGPNDSAGNRTSKKEPVTSGNSWQSGQKCRGPSCVGAGLHASLKLANINLSTDGKDGSCSPGCGRIGSAGN